MKFLDDANDLVGKTIMSVRQDYDDESRHAILLLTTEDEAIMFIEGGHGVSTKSLDIKYIHKWNLSLYKRFGIITKEEHDEMMEKFTRADEEAQKLSLEDSIRKLMKKRPDLFPSKDE